MHPPPRVSYPGWRWLKRSTPRRPACFASRARVDRAPDSRMAAWCLSPTAHARRACGPTHPRRSPTGSRTASPERPEQNTHRQRCENAERRRHLHRPPRQQRQDHVIIRPLNDNEQRQHSRDRHPVLRRGHHQRRCRVGNRPEDRNELRQPCNEIKA